MPKKSAGILLYRIIKGNMELFLVHPGGPLWNKKDLGAWSIPKGEFENEEPLSAAKREFFEETGFAIDGQFTPLTPIKQKSGKTIYAWAVAGNIDGKKSQSNYFELEWPPHSGKSQSFPEIDKADWFSVRIANQKIVQGQVGFIKELIKILGEDITNNQ
jgi:predicted NUDIX family NTP pyrophosphohydrolase